MEATSITSLFIYPRNRYYCEFTINNGEKHTKKYRDMYEFAAGLIPEKSKIIYDLVFGLQPLLIFPATKEVIPMSFNSLIDKEAAKKHIDNEQRKNILKSHQNNKKVSFDEKIKNLSKNNLTFKF